MKKKYGKPLQKKKIKSFSSNFLLETGTIADIRAAKKNLSSQLNQYWNYYSELAQQRSALQEQLTEALLLRSQPYQFKHWQRAVKYKYSFHPLSVAGSLNGIGGRFNTGLGVNPELPSFPCLYLAENKDTALQEQLGQQNNTISGLTPRELALTAPHSETIVCVSGKLEKIFDLTKAKQLLPYLKITKNFVLSKKTSLIADQFNLAKPNMIKTTRQLLRIFLQSKWRILPSHFDIPAHSQIFGHLIYIAGIEGILYPSKFTKALCLALFPKNFSGTQSYIQLDDPTPHSKIPTKIDGMNWRITEFDSNEIFNK